MKTEPLAIFEMSLLTKADIAVRDAYEVILIHHQDDTEVTGLFADLITDWDSDSSLKMIKPFSDRAIADADYKLATEFVELGAMTGMVEEQWSLLAYALLLKRKILTQGVVPEDVEFGRYILRQCRIGGVTEVEMLTWSDDSMWQEIVSRGVDTFPENWWGAVGASATLQELPSRPEIERALSDAGAPECVDEIQSVWNRYSTVFFVIKNSESVA